MDSRLLDVLEEAFGDELALIPDLGGLEEAVQSKLRTLGSGLLQRVAVPRHAQGIAAIRRCFESSLATSVDGTTDCDFGRSMGRARA